MSFRTRHSTWTTYLEPDFVFYKGEQPLAELRGDNGLLVVPGRRHEPRVRQPQGAAYASFCIRALWVINPGKLTTCVYRRNPRMASRSLAPRRAGMKAGGVPPPRIGCVARVSNLALAVFSEQFNSTELLNSRFGAPSFRHGR